MGLSVVEGQRDGWATPGHRGLDCFLLMADLPITRVVRVCRTYRFENGVRYGIELERAIGVVLRCRAGFLGWSGRDRRVRSRPWCRRACGDERRDHERENSGRRRPHGRIVLASSAFRNSRRAAVPRLVPDTRPTPDAQAKAPEAARASRAGATACGGALTGRHDAPRSAPRRPRCIGGLRLTARVAVRGDSCGTTRRRVARGPRRAAPRG